MYRPRSSQSRREGQVYKQLAIIPYIEQEQSPTREQQMVNYLSLGDSKVLERKHLSWVPRNECMVLGADNRRKSKVWDEESHFKQKKQHE